LKPFYKGDFSTGLELIQMPRFACRVFGVIFRNNIFIVVKRFISKRRQKNMEQAVFVK